jgi:hypothetical protein
LVGDEFLGRFCSSVVDARLGSKVPVYWILRSVHVQIFSLEATIREYTKVIDNIDVLHENVWATLEL